MSIDFNHHAYLIESRQSINEVLDALSEEGIITSGNPDLFIIEEETFKIESAKKVGEVQSRKKLTKDLPTQIGKKIILLKFNFITREAQNALLKTLEEPTAHTHFIILTPSEEIFLPTIKSRLEVLSNPFNDTATKRDGVHKFINSPVKKRLDIVGKIIKDIKDKDNDVGKSTAKSFIDALIVEMRRNKKKISREKAGYLKNLIKYSGYLNDRAPSIKQILEYAAINLPKI